MKPKVDSGKTDAKFNHLPCAVSGTVRNAQGAAVPYAAVVVIETATGVRHPLDRRPPGELLCGWAAPGEILHHLHEDRPCATAASTP